MYTKTCRKNAHIQQLYLPESSYTVFPPDIFRRSEL